MRLRGKGAVVTGGSRGIGYATAEAFLREGAAVAVADITRESADGAVEKLRQEYPSASLWGISPDLDSPESVQRAFDEGVQIFGRVDILVNDVGISESTPFASYTEPDYDRVMDRNVRGVFHAAHAAVRHMVRQGQGVILNTSSVASVCGQSGGAAYPHVHVRCQRTDRVPDKRAGPKGIRVNAVASGIMETDRMRAVPEETLEPLIARIPLCRLGQPEDVAHAFVFLASDEASHITGVVLQVDGMARL